MEISKFTDDFKSWNNMQNFYEVDILHFQGIPQK